MFGSALHMAMQQPNIPMPDRPSTTAQVSPSCYYFGLLRGFMPPAHRDQGFDAESS
jgi:hypothetical protein